MPRIDIVRASRIKRSARVIQMEGMFDLPPADQSAQEWSVDFELPKEWHIGLIVGPSGSGKTTIAREVWGGGWLAALIGQTTGVFLTHSQST